MKRAFTIAQDEREDGAELICTPNADAVLLEAEGNAFGLWLLENGSTPFLRGLQEVLREAEIDKKVASATRIPCLSASVLSTSSLKPLDK